MEANRNRNSDPFEFYRTENTYVRYLKDAAEHFLIAAASSVDSERFFKGAASIYQNKQRNRLSADAAAKLLFIKATESKEKKEFLTDDDFEEEVTEIGIGNDDDIIDVEPFVDADNVLFS